MSEWNKAGQIAKALTIAKQYGQIEGDHHRAWVIDQMVRALMPTPGAYELWRQMYEADGEHLWNEGIAP